MSPPDPAQVSARLAALKGSPTLAVASRAGELRAAGVDVLSFAAGEPDFATPDHIRQAANEAAEGGQTRYTPASGTPALREAIAQHHRAQAGTDYSPSEILVSCGAKHALYNLFQALIEPGDAVLIPTPYWVSYPAQAQLAGGITVPVETDSAFVPTPGGLRASARAARAAGATPKVLILNSPCNPSGAGYGRDALCALVDEALALDLSIVSDEIYGRLTYDGFEHVSVASLSDDARARTFLVDGVSKTYAMTGWRVGWVCGQADIIAAAGRLQSQSTSGPCSISQAASIAALNGPHAFLTEWLAAYDERRKAMVDGLNALPGVTCRSPQGAFYVFPSVTDVLTAHPDRFPDDQALALHLLEAVGVACVPGAPFGAPGHLRLSYAASLDQCREGLDRLGAALERL